MPRRKQRSTWGSVERLPSGRWRIRWWHQGSRHSETIDGTRKDAERRLAELRVRVGDEQAAPTVGYVWQHWLLPKIERKGKPATVKAHDVTWRNHVQPRWGSTRVDAVRVVDVQMWLDGMTHSVALSSSQLLSRILDAAVAMDALDRNRLRSAELVLPTAGNRQSRHVWSLDELRRIHDACRGDAIEPLFLAAAFGGLRLGEALALTPADVLPAVGGTAAVSVTKQATLSGAIAEPKTARSRRTAIVPQPWAARLLELARAALDRGDALLVDDGFGRPVGRAMLHRRWRHVCEAAHVEPAPFRNLRASFETLMHWDGGLETSQIQKLLGHTKPTITHEVYDRPDVERLASAVAGVTLAL